MYVPSVFRESDLGALQAMIGACGLANLVTATPEGVRATPLPLFLAADEGKFGTLYGHVARANPQWSRPPAGEALAIFMGPDAYVSPSWYPSKAAHHKVVPTWNYETVHAYGAVEFFADRARLHDVVERLTDLHEGARAQPWAVSDAPADFVAAQLGGIVGVRMPIARLEGKRKMSQNRPVEDRQGVAKALAASTREMDQAVSRRVARGAPEL